MASFHSYGDGSCLGTQCWSPVVASVYLHVPVVTGELGEYDCKPSYVSGYMDWADAHGISYLGWAWNVSSCGGGPALISNYSGTPTPFGQAFRDRFLSRRATGRVTAYRRSR